MMECEEHHKEATSTCTWCAKKICDTCIEWAYGKKLCSTCYAKLTNDGVKIMPRKKREEVMEKKEITNKDPTLSEEDILKARERLQGKEKKRKGVLNIPDKENKW